MGAGDWLSMSFVFVYLCVHISYVCSVYVVTCFCIYRTPLKMRYYILRGYTFNKLKYFRTHGWMLTVGKMGDTASTRGHK